MNNNFGIPPNLVIRHDKSLRLSVFYVEKCYLEFCSERLLRNFLNNETFFYRKIDSKSVLFLSII
jgi:hypothetical protein